MSSDAKLDAVLLAIAELDRKVTDLTTKVDNLSAKTDRIDARTVAMATKLLHPVEKREVMSSDGHGSAPPLPMAAKGADE
ncbi:MAG: hypothetical protein IT379_29560 [Deltaproteobacteria bacterium]|nr:hypothetical protein [Deltaproteobacteria bacterium]